MALNARAGLSAYQGRFDDAWADHRRCLAILDELGRSVMAAVVGAHVGGLIALLAGDLDAAEERMRRGLRQLRAFGERSFLSTTVAHLAEVVYRQGRLDEADDLTRESEAAGSADDIATQASWRQVRAKVAARRRELGEAERLAREAVALWEPTDWLVSQANAARDLAEVLAASGRHDEAVSRLEQALALYERKGDVVDSARTRELLAAAGATPS
jgi:tetratricopeptide (TPR) repeat protein